MVQFYMLSIICNIIAGLYLFLSPENKGSKKEDKTDKTQDRPQIILPGLMSVLSNKMVKFWLGSSAIIIGIFKMLSPVGINAVVILGDLLPVLSSILVGSVLIIDFFKSSSEVVSDTMKKLDTVVIKNKKYFGMISIVVGILHFLVPGVIIL